MPYITTKDGQTYSLALRAANAKIMWSFSVMQIGDRVTFPLGTGGARKAIGASRSQAHRMRTKTGWPFRLKYEYQYEYEHEFSRAYDWTKGQVTITRIE